MTLKKQFSVYFSIFFLMIGCQSKKKTVDKNDALKTKITTYLEQSEINGFSGAVLVAKNDSIIVNKGFGMADKENNISNSPNTVFDICSVTKQFTAAAILKLVENNKLNLEDPISKYFDDLPDDKKNITIHQLLTHTAGFNHGNTDDFDLSPKEVYFSGLFHSKLLFQPGTQYKYSNEGYSILGRIIELVSGQNYESYVNKNLFQPSGMQRTGYLMPDWDKETIANEYMFNVTNEGSHIAHYKQDREIARTLIANGGINSTNNDMYKWYQALNSNKILSQESIQKLTAPYVAEYEDNSSHYAYGWAIFKSKRGTKVITHNGFNGITYYEFVWFPEENAVILLASNAYTRSVGRMTLDIEKTLFDKTYSPKAISKDKVSELYKITENYTGNLADLGEEIKLKFKDEINSPRLLNRLGGIYYRKNKIKKAIAIYELNTQIFPKDGNSWDSLGDAYFKANEKENAIDAYTKALELKPDNGDCFWCSNSKEKRNFLIK